MQNSIGVNKSNQHAMKSQHKNEYSIEKNLKVLVGLPSKMD
jgi:hypothetical protein